MSVPTTIYVKGRRTRVRLEGAATNPPTLLLHGIGRSLEDWGPQYPRLAANHRLIAVDLPGSGFSQRDCEPISLTVLARGALDTLDALGELRPVHVIGNSLGGAVAQQILALQPDRVASLTLVSSAGFGSEVAPMLRLLAMPVLGRLMTMRTTRFSATMSERMGFADARHVTSVRIDHALAIAREPDTAAVLVETAQAFATVRGVKAGWRDELASAVAPHPKPTLIMWGNKDQILPVQQLAAARRVYPHAQTHVFTGTGHMAQIERPDEFASLVLPFLASAASTDVDSEADTASVPTRRRGNRRRAAKSA